MLMANMNVKGQCPDGWSSVIDAEYTWWCDWTYSYCYYQDPSTGQYYIKIIDIVTPEPCWSFRTGQTSWNQIKAALRDSLLSQIVKFLTTTNIWDDIEIPQKPGNFCFWFVNTPTCYPVGYQGYEHKNEPCTDKTPRPCNLALVMISWDYKYDEYQQPMRDDSGNIIYITYVNRTWYPPPQDYSGYYTCPPYYIPLEPTCLDNCY